MLQRLLYMLVWTTVLWVFNYSLVKHNGNVLLIKGVLIIRHGDVWALKAVQFLLWAVRAPPGSPIVDVSAPVVIGTILHVIAAGSLN